MTHDSVHIRYTKWDGSLHWNFHALRLGHDEHGTWVLVPPGGAYRRGMEPDRIDEHGFVVLLPDRTWWTAYFNAVPRHDSGTLVYVDINTAVTWEDDTAHLVDLDLDVTISADGSVHLLDEDEFSEHQTRFGYPADVVDRVRATAARVFGMAERRDEPFGRAGFGVLARTLGWAHGVVVSGHGAASGAGGDPRFPGGTLSHQRPHFSAAGLNLDDLHSGTINVALDFQPRPTSPLARIEDLTWMEGYPAESFTFCDARIAVDGAVHRALWYRPDPTTKPEFHQPPTVVELLAPRIDGIEAGRPVSVWLDPDQAEFTDDC